MNGYFEGVMLGGIQVEIKEGVYGIVLASGQSTRMGKPKLLLTLEGAPIIEHVLLK